MGSHPKAPPIDMSWQDVEDAVAVLLGQFKEAAYEPSMIIAVAKGGVVPATLLHQAFPDAHFETIHVASYSNDFIPRSPRIIGKTPHTPQWSQTLIVDDILESGATTSFLKGIYPAATYAYMVCRTWNAEDCLYRGLIYDKGWITFPWERKLEVTGIPF